MQQIKRIIIPGTSPDNPLEEKPTLPDGNGTSGETMGDGVYNPDKSCSNTPN